AVTSAGAVSRWEWLKWLPHAGSEFSPLSCEHLASSAGQIGRLTAELEEVIRDREEMEESKTRKEPGPLPIVLVLVQDDAVEERARMVQLAENGPEQGVHLLWVAASTERLPAACRTFLEVDPATGEGKTGYVRSGEGVVPVELEPLSPDEAMAFARALSPVVDAGALLLDQSDLPHAVSFLALTGLGIANDPTEVVEHWRGSNSIPEPDAPKLKRDSTLRSLVGQGISDRYYLDLRTQGPHALVGGTTGSGKSEFLQSWILGMAAAHSPARVNFLLIDYKGGTAFADCVNLPHSVGLVTDLSPHLVRRALTSLKAELKRREHILNAHGAKDLLDMEKHRHADTPPSLVIVVDEFAALVGEVPEFVDGIVDVAQRGRSLGLHLILATQRPSGVIKGSLRANTNLRVALRIADEEDSNDVVGSAIAASFDPSLPGRAVAKTGPGRLAGFQTAYVGGHTTSKPPPPPIDVREMPFGLGLSWEEPEEESPASTDAGPKDITRMVKTIRAANDVVALPPARKPWLPELSATYRLERLPTPRNDEELVYGVIDRPEDQEQPVVAFEPDRDGNMVVYGTGGSGKSTFLRAITVAAGLAPARGGPCHVYALDFGARGLTMLDEFPHVGAVINGDDSERTARLLKMLRAMIDERAERYSAVNASTVVEYRELAGSSGEPRVLLLVDNFGAFRQEYEAGPRGNPHEMLEAIAADGRAVGVHVIVTADRANALSTSLRSVVQSQMCLRLTSDNDFMALGVPLDVFGEDTPPGRGIVGDNEIQVGVLGGSQNMGRQAVVGKQLAEAMGRADVNLAPPIDRLSESVAMSSLPESVEGRPVLGIWDETLAPIAFDPVGTFLVAGPPQSGKTTAILSLLESLQRSGFSDAEYVLFGPRKSAVAALGRFSETLLSPEEGREYSEQLVQNLSTGQGRGASGLVVVIEDLSEWVGSAADDSLQMLVRVCRSEGHFVIVEGEIASFSGTYGLPGVTKSDRCGIVLQPDQINGDQVLSTEFPRVKRADFPQGRGLYVKSGRVLRVQMPVPEENTFGWRSGARGG
ncbi:MAG: FtsK/SpoIIIE domain-containing protein, partial [Actinomycetota bacterium]|nr:FtsK/SpoIIIE domain-containing protein [Actinomycetota bacterium]